MFRCFSGVFRFFLGQGKVQSWDARNNVFYNLSCFLQLFSCCFSAGFVFVVWCLAGFCHCSFFWCMTVFSGEVPKHDALLNVWSFLILYWILIGFPCFLVHGRVQRWGADTSRFALFCFVRGFIVFHLFVVFLVSGRVERWGAEQFYCLVVFVWFVWLLVVFLCIWQYCTLRCP